MNLEVAASLKKKRYLVKYSYYWCLEETGFHTNYWGAVLSAFFFFLMEVPLYTYHN